MNTDDYFDAHAAGQLAAYRDILALLTNGTDALTVQGLTSAIASKAIDAAVRAAQGRTDAA